MNNHYFSELYLLQQSAKAFAERYPQQARFIKFDAASGDPAIDHLLQSMAFLNARTKQLLDDDLPEISELFLKAIAPWLLNDLPSVCITQFKSRVAHRNRFTSIDKHLMLKSPPLGEENVQCVFITCNQLDYVPLSLLLEKSQQNSLVLQFHNASDSQITFPNCIDLFIDQSFVQACQLYYLFLHEVTSVIHLQNTAVNPAKIDFCFSPLSFQSVFSDEDKRTALDCVIQFFSYPEKLFFFRMTCISDLIVEAGSTIRFQVTFKSELPSNIHSNSLVLNCVPAINQYQRDCEPIHYEPIRSIYPLVIDRNFSESYDLVEVDRVSCIDTFTMNNSNVPSILQSDDNESFTYQIIKPINQLANYYLRFSPAEASATISVTATVNNKMVPHQCLALHQLRLVSSEVVNELSATNITKASRYLVKHRGKLWQWKLINLLKLNFQSLLDKETLSAMLIFLNHSLSQHDVSRALVSLHAKPQQTISHGSFSLGLRIDIELDEKYFESLGHAYLFSSMLFYFYKQLMRQDGFVELHAQNLPSGKEFYFAKDVGEQCMI